MTTAHEEQEPHDMFSLTRMIYTVCSASILYRVTWELLSWFLFRKLQQGPWGQTIWRDSRHPSVLAS
jgi:hypothetical protein